MAFKGLIRAEAPWVSYRYRGPYGWIYIGARDDADALVQAARSTDAPLTRDNLETPNTKGTAYVPVEVP